MKNHNHWEMFIEILHTLMAKGAIEYGFENWRMTGEAPRIM